MSFTLSLVFHLGLVAFRWASAHWAEPSPQPPVKRLTLITIPWVREPEAPREFLEAPARAPTTPPDKADFLSDKTLRASQAELSPELPEGGPFARGVVDVVNLSPQPGGPGGPGDGSPHDLPSPGEAGGSPPASEEGLPRPDLRLRMGPPGSPGVVLPGGGPPAASYRQSLTRAEDLLDLSFNTQAWNWAPYAIELKRRIADHWYPPLAFFLGIASGLTTVRFKILPQGEMRDFQVLEQEGHGSLRQSSVNAVLTSAPFAPLPTDFPEDYLDVTFRFHYIILR